MARPSKNTDQRLIQAAQELLRDSSFSRLGLRQVAARAGVNPGMFHYHFKTKDQFLRAVLQDGYEKFFKDFSLRVEGEEKPLDKLRQALFALARFARDNRRFGLTLLREVLDGNREVRDFLWKNVPRHGKVMVQLIRRCQKEGSLARMPLPQAAAFLMPAVAAAAFGVAGLESQAPSLLARGLFKGLGALVLSDAAIRKRVDMALHGLGADNNGPTRRRA
ncbi:MAG TPA: TetR/AcrR family transcriptional regulator [bacterium]|nr:TetR/AcrR family transcriptional regulator [bacterium]